MRRSRSPLSFPPSSARPIAGARARTRWSPATTSATQPTCCGRWRARNRTHEFNASAFAARVVASTGSDLTSCVVGAIAALKGPAHGGATLAARNMLDKIGSAENAEKWLTDAHAKHERFSGFGHRVYRTYDPRAKILREMARTAAPDLHRTAARTEEIALKILHDAHPERPNATNVDFWASVVLTGAGIPKELFTTMFATSRVSGWTAHVLESLSDLRIIRPASRWIGPEPGRKPLQLAKR
ncbi:MAG: citrate/2-methylcitrate synthase [Chloroflexi bacterium]|nr:MAG: citrate/2-methylcitrate synthase [Chloroflexota bacterium]